MKMRKKVLYIILIINSLIISIFIYWYLNPSIDNTDFDIEYKISSGKKTYDELRNKKYTEQEYSFNHQTYYNNNERTKLIIHSLDKDKVKGEKVIFVIENSIKKPPIGIIDYLNKNNELHIFRIKYKTDSIFLYHKPFLDEKESLFFYGITGSASNLVIDKK